MSTVLPQSPRRTAFGPDHPTRAQVALHAACKSHPGDGVTKGIAYVAKLIGMDSDVLQKKLSPTCETHHLTLDEAERITLATQITVAADELARAAKCMCIPDQSADSAGTLHEAMGDEMAADAAFVAEFAEATRDNLISDNESRRLSQKFSALISRGSRVLRLVRAKAATNEPVVCEMRR